jgi:rhodanese-related sulfurtransferase
LIEEHLKAAGDQQEREEKTDSDYAHQLHLALVREPVAPPELFKSYIRKVEATKKSEGCVELLSKVVLMLLLVVFAGKCFSNLPGSRRYNNLPPPMNFNVAMPRFTPSPMPELQLRNFVFHIPPDMLEVGMILKTTTVVDVRAKNEYDAGHIAGALSIPAGELAARAKRLPKSKRVVFYDDGAGNAESAALELQTLGFTEVAVLEGGYQAWLDARKPVEQQRARTRKPQRLVMKGTSDPQ